MKVGQKSRNILGIIIALGLFTSACQANNYQAAKNEAKIEEETWDLLWVTDSSGWGVAEIYGQYIAEDNEVEVNVLDKWKGGLSAGRILNALSNQDDNEYDMTHLRENIAKSEVIVIYGNPEDSENSLVPGDWNCGQNILDKCYVNSCELNNFKTYISDLKEIYSIIFEIRKGMPTIVRAIDAYNPRLASHCTQDDVLNECIECWENYNAAIHQAAQEMGVPVAKVFDAWNGLDHSENPVEKGYTREDNEHPNTKGATVIAQLLRDLGYVPMIP
jgi:hypothetical protein